MTTSCRILPEETSVFDAATLARAAGQHLLCNGRKSCLSAALLPGWCKVGLAIKPRRKTLEGLACAN